MKATILLLAMITVSSHAFSAGMGLGVTVMTELKAMLTMDGQVLFFLALNFLGLIGAPDHSKRRSPGGDHI